MYRQINSCYKDDYQAFISSGLYDKLCSDNMLIPHVETDVRPVLQETACNVIKPEPVPFITYPYEWCFSQIKDAALLTLRIEKIALEHGMTLKDASAYNVQYVNGRPIFIDTLSFERYADGDPWVAYRQFCQHFLAPLLLMQYTDIRLNQLLRVYIDGIPLDLASRLLPLRTYLKTSSLMHIHFHARSQKKHADTTVPTKPQKTHVSKTGRLGLVDNLTTAVENFSWHPAQTEWGDYYFDNSYSSAAFAHKKELVIAYLDQIHPASVWDFGANTGEFSRLASSKGIRTIAFDIDPACVERNYRHVQKNAEQSILPLLLDLANPSPGMGWANLERDSLTDRGPVEAILALALVHHLAITNNVPFDRIASFFSRLCAFLAIEYVPREDAQVQRMLAGRKGIAHDYSQHSFEQAFGQCFTLLRTDRIKDSQRVMYLWKKA